MRAHERSSQLGDEFFLRVAFIAPLLPAEITRKARRVLRPVRELMGESGVIALRVTETFKRRHLNIIDFLRIISAITAMPDGGLRAGEELVGPIDAGQGIEPWCGLGVVMIRQAVNLLYVKHGVAFQVRDFVLNVLPGLFVALSPGDGVCVDNEGAFLALADVSIQFNGLAEVIQMGAAKPCAVALIQRERMLIPE